MNPEIQAVLDGESDGVIITGDCMEVMADMPDGCVDACLMDPPYGIAHSSNHGASWENTQIAGDGDTSLRDAAIQWANARLLPWAAFGTWKVATPRAAKGVLVWDKGPASGMGDLTFPWKATWEEIAVGGKGWQGSRDESILRGHRMITWESKGRSHPHQKPESLMRYLIGKLPTADIILDPFCGSGTTCVAAKKLGRRYIGIEISPKYAEIARNRVRNTPKPLFTEPAEKPEQAELFAEKP